jgi:hypothetical protein
MEDVLKGRGAMRGSAETPGEFIARLSDAPDPDQALFAEVIRMYHEVRFGGMPLDGAILRRLEKRLDAIGARPRRNPR